MRKMQAQVPGVRGRRDGRQERRDFKTAIMTAVKTKEKVGILKARFDSFLVAFVNTLSPPWTPASQLYPSFAFQRSLPLHLGEQWPSL